MSRPILRRRLRSSAPHLRSSPLRAWLRSRLAWDLLLALLTLVAALMVIGLFFPGRMNVDIANQYQQAIGRIPVTDWHPPVMSAVWSVLIDLTGQPGSLLVLQVGLLAVAALSVGVLVNRSGAPRWVSLLGPAVLATPWVLSQMTTLWKDSQMAAALSLAVVLLAITRRVPKTWVLWLPALALLVYAVGLRKNAVFALVPIAVYGAVCLVHARRSRRSGESGQDETAPVGSRERSAGMVRTPRRLIVGLSVLLTAVVGLGTIAVDAVIESRVEVHPTSQISQIFLDDVMFSVPESRLQASDAPRELKDHISQARDKCLAKGEIWDAYWNCYGRGVGGRAFSPVAYQDELKSLWLNEVITHPLSYIEYRAAVFSTYFFTSSLEYWEADWDGDARMVGYESGSVKADFIVRPYVEDFALGTFPMFFKPWFWTLVALILITLAIRANRSRVVGHRTLTFWPEITVLATSALGYVIGYVPIVPANHFRYTLWPALALTLAFVLWVAERTTRDEDRAPTSLPDPPGPGTPRAAASGWVRQAWARHGRVRPVSAKVRRLD